MKSLFYDKSSFVKKFLINEKKKNYKSSNFIFYLYYVM